MSKSYEQRLEDMTREQLIDKIQNQRTEINCILEARNRESMHATARELTIRTAAKLMRNGGLQYTAAYSILTNKCADGVAVLREVAKYG